MSWKDTCWSRAGRGCVRRCELPLCTCLDFMLHGDCEHVAFVLALQDEGEAKPRVNLAAFRSCTKTAESAAVKTTRAQAKVHPRGGRRPSNPMTWRSEEKKGKRRMLFNPGVAPTVAVITKNVGEAIVKLICSEGSDLDKMMEATRPAADGPLGKIEYFFQDHCAVMRGHLPNSSWPRHR